MSHPVVSEALSAASDWLYPESSWASKLNMTTESIILSLAPGLSAFLATESLLHLPKGLRPFGMAGSLLQTIISGVPSLCTKEGNIHVSSDSEHLIVKHWRAVKSCLGLFADSRQGLYWVSLKSVASTWCPCAQNLPLHKLLNCKDLLILLIVFTLAPNLI